MQGYIAGFRSMLNYVPEFDTVLVMLNNLDIHAFYDLVVIQFSMPQNVLESELGASATTAYSQRLNTFFAPRSNYERGQADEAFIAEAYEPTITAQTDTGTYIQLSELGHIDLLADEALFEVTSAWLSDLH